MSRFFNIDGVKIYLTPNLVTALDKNLGEFIPEIKFGTEDEKKNKYISNCYGVIYIPKENNSTCNNYKENEKSLFKLNIKSILNTDIDNFNYEKLFKTFLYYLGENLT